MTKNLTISLITTNDLNMSISFPPRSSTKNIVNMCKKKQKKNCKEVLSLSAYRFLQNSNTVPTSFVRKQCVPNSNESK